jgi:hypothetical protein
MAKETVQAGAPAEQTASTTTRQGAQPVKIDTSDLKSSYCNVCNASSTREEVVLNFGVNQNWDLGQRNLDVHLLHRIILSPFAAKRLQEMLNKLIAEHESRYGELK